VILGSTISSRTDGEHTCISSTFGTARDTIRPSSAHDLSILLGPHGANGIDRRMQLSQEP
jgi:hypothetical protein